MDRISAYLIPANYTDSGLLLGLFKTRNAIEAGIIVLLVGVPEYKLITAGLALKTSIMVVTLLPLIIFAAAGLEGDSLFERLFALIRFSVVKKKLHMRRIGYQYEQARIKKQSKIAKVIKNAYDLFG